MSNVPLARARLLVIADQIEEAGMPLVARELRSLVPMLTRRRHKKVTAEPECRKLTPELRDAIVAQHRDDPGLSVRELAIMFDVNQGRVSEAIMEASL